MAALPLVVLAPHPCTLHQCIKWTILPVYKMVYFPGHGDLAQHGIPSGNGIEAVLRKDVDVGNIISGNVYC